MRRVEALAVLAVGLALVVAGVVWLFGPYGLIGSGVLLGVVSLFMFDIREERRGEAVAGPAPLVRR